MPAKYLPDLVTAARVTSNASLAVGLVCVIATRSRARSGAASTLAAPNTEAPHGLSMDWVPFIRRFNPRNAPACCK